MALDKGWHFILCFAVTGFLIAVLAAFCMAFHAPNIVTNLLILASPGLWLFAHEAWGIVSRLWFSFGFFAIANGMLYALVGAVIAGLRRMLKHRNTAK